jgi:hypothetical protein
VTEGRDRDLRGVRLACEESIELLDDCVDALARGAHHARGAELSDLANDLRVLRSAVERELTAVRALVERHGTSTD